MTHFRSAQPPHHSVYVPADLISDGNAGRRLVQALEYGIIDHIIESRSLQPVTK